MRGGLYMTLTQGNNYVADRDGVPERFDSVHTYIPENRDATLPEEYFIFASRRILIPVAAVIPGNVPRKGRYSQHG